MEHNTTNDSLSWVPVAVLNRNCDVWLVNAYGSTTMILVQSILFDFFGGIICGVYLYQFYQGIEISHPIFATLFNNVIISTFLSFASFVSICLMHSEVLSCHSTLPFVAYITITAVLMNAVSWMIIAFLKYHLLSKAENESVDLDKLRKLSLSLSWVIILGITGIRLSIYLFSDIIYPQFAPVLFLTFYIALMITCFVVNYKMDTMLKEKLQIEKQIDHVGIKKKDEQRDISYGIKTFYSG